MYNVIIERHTSRQGCRIRWLHFCKGVRHPHTHTSVYDMTINHLMAWLHSWSFRECRVLLHFHYIQLHSDLEWLYLWVTQLWVKKNCLINYTIPNRTIRVRYQNLKRFDWVQTNGSCRNCYLETICLLIIYIYIYIYISKVCDCSRRWPEGSLFNS